MPSHVHVLRDIHAHMLKGPEALSITADATNIGLFLEDVM